MNCGGVTPKRIRRTHPLRQQCNGNKILITIKIFEIRTDTCHDKTCQNVFKDDQSVCMYACFHSNQNLRDKIFLYVQYKYYYLFLSVTKVSVLR